MPTFSEQTHQLAQALVSAFPTLTFAKNDAAGTLTITADELVITVFSTSTYQLDQTQEKGTGLDEAYLNRFNLDKPKPEGSKVYDETTQYNICKSCDGDGEVPHLNGEGYASCKRCNGRRMVLSHRLEAGRGTKAEIEAKLRVRDNEGHGA